jgi:hypothetical protein
MRRSIGKTIRRPRAGALVAALAVATIAMAPAASSPAANDSLAPPAIGVTKLSSDQACAMIRRALHGLARAERKQALALDLDPDGHGDTAMVQAQLAILLERSDELRDALRIVRQSGFAGDENVERCSAMGLHALVEAERLTTTVEEVLYGPNLGNPLPGTNLRSAAAPTAVVPPKR